MNPYKKYKIVMNNNENTVTWNLRDITKAILRTPSHILEKKFAYNELSVNFKMLEKEIAKHVEN